MAGLEGKNLVSKVISLKAAGLKPRSPNAQDRAAFFFFFHCLSKLAPQGWDTWIASGQGPQAGKKRQTPATLQAPDWPGHGRWLHLASTVNNPIQVRLLCKPVSLFAQITQYKNETQMPASKTHTKYLHNLKSIISNKKLCTEGAWPSQNWFWSFTF